jgi:hypothetical protein
MHEERECWVECKRREERECWVECEMREERECGGVGLL